MKKPTTAQTAALIAAAQRTVLAVHPHSDETRDAIHALSEALEGVVGTTRTEKISVTSTGGITVTAIRMGGKPYTQSVGAELADRIVAWIDSRDSFTPRELCAAFKITSARCQAVTKMLRDHSAIVKDGRTWRHSKGVRSAGNTLHKLRKAARPSAS